MAVIEGTSALAIYASTFLATDFGSDQTRRRPGRDQIGMAAAEGLEGLGARCSHPTPARASQWVA